MSFRNKLELQRLYTNAQLTAQITELFSIREFYKSAIPGPDYQAADVWADAVVLTELGNSRLEFLTGAAGVSRADAHMAFFLAPYQQELEVDPSKTDFGRLWAQLSAEVIGGLIRHPWVYGRLLYDRFFDMFPSSTKELTYHETDQLFQGTPSGVFQIGTQVIGPFGLLRSAERRYLHPATSAPLWHCSDSACLAIHPVKFGAPSTELKKGLIALRDQRRSEGPPSEWLGFYAGLVEPYSWYDPMYPASLPWLLANGFAVSEQRAIVTELLDKTNVRGSFPQTRRFAGLVTGSGSQVSSRMGPDFLLQSLLLATDVEIIGAVENAISAGEISIPATEVRSAPVKYGGNGWFDINAECSRNGVRLWSARPGFALRNLRATVAEVYQNDDDRQELTWKLRRYAGKTPYQQLDNFLRENQPTSIIRELFFDSRLHLKRLFDVLRYGNLAFPISVKEEELLLSKVLWKLGFNPPFVSACA